LVHNNGIIYTENNQGCCGGNRNAMIRVYNRNSTATTYFGVVVNPGKVATIAGNISLGAQWWNSGNEGQPANSVAIYRPESLATDGTNLYFSAQQYNCIMKIDSAGIITTYSGRCRESGGTTGLVNGSPYDSTSIRYRYPYQIAIDPLHTADGNLFIADQTDQGTSRIRYINTKGVSVTIADQTIPANSVQTLFSSDGYGYGVAAHGNWICYTSGRAGNGHQGSHNIWCYDRTDNFATSFFRIGPSGTGMRGGIQLGVEQEGSSAPSATFFTPYRLLFDNLGNLFISEYDGHVIRKVERWY
jgi:hypothetical protein